MRNLVVFLLLTLTITAYAQIRPIDREITDAKVRDGIYEREYVIGIGTAPKHLPDAKKLAQEDAIANVFLQVANNVRAVIHASRDEPFHEDVSEHYSTVAQMPIVPIQMPRIVRVRLSSGRSSDDTNTYAVVAYNRQEIIDLYTQKAKKLRTEINQILAEGLRGDTESVAEQYLGTYRRYEALKEAELIIVGTEYKPNAKAAFDKLYNYMDTEGSQEETIDFLDSYFQNVSPLAINTPNTVAQAITMQLEIQGAASPHTKVQLDEFTYGTTEVPTGFAPILIKGMELKMMGKWTPVLKSASGPWNSYGLGSNVDARLTGTYWERGNKVTIRTALRDARTGDFKAVAIVRFNKGALGDKVREDKYKPGNYEDIGRDQMIAAHDTLGGSGGSNWKSPQAPTGGGSDVVTTTPAGGSEVIPTTPAGGGLEVVTTTPVSETTEPIVQNEGFKLQLKTKKGPGSQTYMIGERMWIQVKVNQPGYIRVVYQQDGRWSQLTEDLKVPSAGVSKWLEVPGNFVCVEPEGVGQLMVLAKTEPFKPFTDVYYEDGHRYIGKRPAPPGTITTAQRDAEAVEVQYVLRGFMNKDLKENVVAAKPILRDFVNLDPAFQKSNSNDTTTTLVIAEEETVVETLVVAEEADNHIGKAIESIYITTVSAE